MRFTAFKLITQIAVPLALAFALGAAAFVGVATLTTRTLDKAYSDLLLDRDAAAMLSLSGAAIGAVVLVALLVASVRATASRPLVALSATMRRLADGDLEVEV